MSSFFSTLNIGLLLLLLLLLLRIASSDQREIWHGDAVNQSNASDTTYFELLVKNSMCSCV